MNFITGKSISRRTMLKGMSGAIGLPLLEALRRRTHFEHFHSYVRGAPTVSPTLQTLTSPDATDVISHGEIGSPLFAGLTAAQLNDILHASCRNPSYNREIWIVGAKMAR